MDYESVSRVIHAARAAEEAGEALEVTEELEAGIGAAMVWGLVAFEALDAPPMVMGAAEQYLAMGGDVDQDVLLFLAFVLDDLHTRRAVLDAGSVLVGDFRSAVLAGRATEHASEIVPPAFAAVVDERMAIDLYSAAVALMARLSANTAAGCVAEEIVTVELIRHASALLEELPPEEARAATEELYALFDLYEDDDVLALFEMKEPGDAAVAGHAQPDREGGVVDQRPEAWLAPFGDVPLTGHLSETAG